MFKSDTEYYTVFHIDDKEVVEQFTGFDFLDGIQLSYASSEREDLVMNAFYEVLTKIDQIPDVKLKRHANRLHYSYDKTAKVLEEAVVEKHEIYFKDNLIGSGIACVTGTVIPALSTVH